MLQARSSTFDDPHLAFNRDENGHCRLSLTQKKGEKAGPKPTKPNPGQQVSKPPGVDIQCCFMLTASPWRRETGDMAGLQRELIASDPSHREFGTAPRHPPRRPGKPFLPIHAGRNIPVQAIRSTSVTDTASAPVFVGLPLYCYPYKDSLVPLKPTKRSTPAKQDHVTSNWKQHGAALHKNPPPRPSRSRPACGGPYPSHK